MNKSSETIDRPNASFARTFLPITQANLHPTGEMYYDPAVLEREKQVIFGQDWLCIGRAEEIPNVGMDKALRIVEQPILLCRTADGAITAYSNTDRIVAWRSQAVRATRRNFPAPIMAGSTASTAG